MDRAMAGPRAERMRSNSHRLQQNKQQSLAQRLGAGLEGGEGSTPTSYSFFFAERGGGGCAGAAAAGDDGVRLAMRSGSASVSGASLITSNATGTDTAMAAWLARRRRDIIELPGD